MQSYTENSPEAMAQLLTALMAADDRIDDAEIEALGVLDAYARIGITPPRFADVLRDYFKDIDASHRAIDRVDCIGACITAPGARVVLWEIMHGLASAGDDISPAEIAFVERVAAVWWNGSLPARLAMPGKARGYVPHDPLLRSLARSETQREPARTG